MSPLFTYHGRWAVTDPNQGDGDPVLDRGNCDVMLVDDVLVEVAPLMAAGDCVLLGRGAHTPRAGALGANAATAASEVPTALADGDTTDMNALGMADTPTTV